MKGQCPKRRGFFSRVDWASFWTATALSFLVYFFTVAPSVTLEDAGELVTAGDHLGVPHPPGYPLWTVCAFLSARVLSFVHYMGQPNPAWAIALMSGVFAAFAAGITSMLITRSSADMLEELDPALLTADAVAQTRRASRHALLSWVGGVAGSLVFAFSPVEWSQAAIPEVYTLNSLFLMWVFLLSYRWMRRPSDKVLWAVAFIFGLGLTNYQVLLFAIVPLVLIILFRDIALFRDLALTILPFLLTAGILMLGAEVSKPGFAKIPPTPALKNSSAPLSHTPPSTSSLRSSSLPVPLSPSPSGSSAKRKTFPKKAKLPSSLPSPQSEPWSSSFPSASPQPPRSMPPWDIKAQPSRGALPSPDSSP